MNTVRWIRRSGFFLKPYVSQDEAQNLVRIEMALGDLPGRVTMRQVIAVDRLQAGDDLLLGAEEQQPLLFGEAPFAAGGLNQSRLARGEITGGAVADPAAVGLDVARLGDAEFGSRELDELAVAQWIAGINCRVEHSPAALLKQADVLPVLGSDAEGKLDAPARGFGEVQEA